jgi:ATP/maltotriose-dependent transcriptional regulator MalT
MTGDPRAIADALHSLGQVLVSQGEFARAIPLYEEAIPLYRAIGGGLAAFPLVSLGVAFAQGGDAGAAGEPLRAGLAEHRAWGNSWGAAFALRALGDLARAAGDEAVAIKHLVECIAAWSVNGFRRGVAYALVGLAAVTTSRGRPEPAVRLLGAAEGLSEGYVATLWRTERAAYESTVAAARDTLGEERFEAAWAAGRAMGMEEVVAATRDLAPPSDAVTQTAGVAVTTARGLTQRELDVLRLLVAGRSDREIAEALFIGRRTAQGHVASILAKLGVGSRTAAATAAIGAGLVPATPRQVS